MTPEERFWAKVDRNGPLPPGHEELGPCWIWTGAKSGGYGSFNRGRETVGAHVFAYELLVGPIPEGCDHLHHVCEVEACVNAPGHCEPLPASQHVLLGTSPPARHAAQTHCHKGHPFSGSNLRINRRGDRACRACHRERERERYRRTHG